MSEIVPIHLRNVPWPAEIFDHPNFIASLAKWYKPNIFVEYGTCNGTATRVYAPFCNRVLGVDIQKGNIDDIKNLEFFNMTTREFKNVLSTLKDPVEMAFIDADHDSKEVFQDFEDLFPYIIENGIIFLHDTFPCEEKWKSKTFCSDSWKVPDMIKKKYGKFCEVLTIPIQPGLTIVKKYTSPLPHLTERIVQISEDVYELNKE